METLPYELLGEILGHLTPASRKTARLACRIFNGILVRDQFRLLASFLDPAVSLAVCEASSCDPARRPAVVWSPRCSVPKYLPIPESFLLALYGGVAGKQWRRPDMAVGDISFKDLSGVVGFGGITEENVTQAYFRYALYLSYNRQYDGAQSDVWVFERIFRSSLLFNAGREPSTALECDGDIY